MKIEKGIVIADTHYPYINKKAVKIMLDITRDVEPDYFINLGDSLDYSQISLKYANNMPKKIENIYLDSDYTGFQRDILDPLHNILSDNCKKVFIKGNHEERVDRYLQYYPTNTGLIEPENNLELGDWNIIPYKQHYKLGNTVYTHGTYHNKYHAFSHISLYGMNVIYGHLHSHQVFTNQTPINKEPLTAMSIGCLCDLNPHYDRNAPNRWTNQMLVFYKEGNKQFNQVITFKGNSRVRTIFNGKLYC